MWGTLFGFVFIISVAMGLAAIRLGFWHTAKCSARLRYRTVCQGLALSCRRPVPTPPSSFPTVERCMSQDEKRSPCECSELQQLAASLTTALREAVEEPP